MELGEGEAQICRLCGQCESIYIDVFGEEGTKRFLGLKIHTKINILIDERDPLPKAICVQCLGKLEFVCDFQEECLRTQQVLRDRYNLPPLTEIAEVKTEDTTPSTSTNNNNDEANKNLNSPNEGPVKDTEQRVAAVRTATKTQRSLRSQQQVKGNEDVTKDQNSSQSSIEDCSENVPTVQSPETTSTRWLRSRQSTETSTSNEVSMDTPIANRLRSHDNSVTETPVSSAPRSSSNETSEKQTGKQQDPHTIQIPTSALNKLLTIVSNSPNIEVSVKESRNHSSDIEDISFTVELCKKESDDVATVRARVFPDQGSCLVDKAIVSLLQNQSCVEVNSIINTIINSSLKNGNSTKLKDSAEFEQKWQASQNPEELFRIDGEEIRVDDNVEHVVTDNQNGYSCKLCCKFYERKDKCMVHVKTHLGIKQYTCILCNAKFVCKSDVMKHIRCSHTNPRPIQCPKCPKRFKSKFYLMEHDNVHKGVRPYSCTDCGQSYHHKVSLQIHMKSHLPPQNLACEYCGKVFPYRTRLLSHIASVHLKNRRNFRCRFCYNLYSSLAVLNEHIKTRHATTYTCEVCSKTFKVASKYKAHVLQHSNPKPFVCNVCNNRYASKAFLNEHLLKHEGLRKHICQKCGARFAQASHLAAHRHVHGEKKHACPECGRKFNRRDNMKIKENDGLPQIVCMRCLGTLEFLCDFYDRCHRTQKELSQASQNETEERIEAENDVESDKENAGPPAVETKRQKSKAPLSDNAKNGLVENSTAEYKPEEKDETDNHVDDRDRGNEHQSAAKVVPSVNRIVPGKIQTTLDSNICSNKKITDQRKDQSIAGNLKYKKGLLAKKEDISKGTAFRTTRSMNDLSSPQNNVMNGSLNSELPVRRKRGRKSKLEKMREASLLARMKREPNGDPDDSQKKRQCLREICANVKSSNATVNAVLSSKPQVEQVAAKEQVIVTVENTTSREARDKTKETDTMHTAERETNERGLRETDSESKSAAKLGSWSTEGSSESSKAISAVIKQEKVEVESITVRQNGKSNQLVWIPNEVLLQRGEDLMVNQVHLGMDQEEIDSRLELPLSMSEKRETGSEEADEENSDSITSSNFSDRKSAVFIGQNGMVDVKSLESRASTKLIVEPGKLCMLADSSNQSTKSDLDCTLSDESLSRRLSQDSSFSASRTSAKDRSFGKISELISDEQKQAIETYYTVNMSIVNSEEVKKNITIVDKKNIRCNICGTLYLRMDKCQVHIWGHLQMKPYQCKACDFATVTVSNVRCHIRKSHLKIKPFACHLCEKRYVTAVLLEEHINTHTGARPYKCKVCDFASSSRQMLNYHNTTHKPVKDINCKICGKEFYSRGRLRAHMIVHNKDKVVVCKLCSAYLSSAEALETHYKNVHMQDYVCNVCGKRVKSRKALHNHQNVHAAAKYKCTLCPNVYKSSQILKEHLLKHEGIRKYKCNVCEKTFGQQSHLAAHMAVHSKIRFHCPGCDKPFNRHDNMKIHTKRCKLFLANPELKNLLTRRDRSTSFNNVKELTAELRNNDTANSEPLVKSQVDESPAAEDPLNDQEKTSLNVCKIGLNISCIEPTDKSWDPDMYDDKEEIATSAELNVIKITNVTARYIPESENLSVLENVLGPESY